MSSLEAVLALYQGHPSDWSNQKKIAVAKLPWLPDDVYEILKDDSNPDVLKVLDDNTIIQMRHNLST